VSQIIMLTLCDFRSFGDLTVFSNNKSNYYDDNYAYSLKSIVCNINSYRMRDDGYVIRKENESKLEGSIQRISIIIQKLFNYLFIATYKRT